MPIRLIQPRIRLSRRNVPAHEQIALPFPVFLVAYRYAHHAKPSGYDRLGDYLGEFVEVGTLRYLAGETILRLPALLDAKFGGVREYSRYDWVLEQEAMARMGRTVGCLYHFLHGDKNYKRAWTQAGRNGNRLVATIHHPPEHFPLFFRSTTHFRYLDRVIAVCSDQVPFLESIVGPGKVSVVHYGVNTNFFRPAADGQRFPRPTCIFAGFHERDFEVLPAVVDGILSRVSDAEFILVSTDPRCVEIARTNTRVTIQQRVDDEAYASLLRRSWLLVLPLRLSTTTTVALEAMASGLPAITTDGGIRDYVLPAGGILCPVGNAEAMVQAASGLLEDATALSAAQAAARRQAERFAWPLVAQRTAAVYSEVMSTLPKQP
jgi:glycosyltransferase involved in cell wall biosynthesis